MTTPSHEPSPIVVRAMYTPAERSRLRDILSERRIELDIGMPRFHSYVTRLVHANRKRIWKETGEAGIYVDQLSVRNLYHFFDGRRTDDERVAILDAYAQLSGNASGPMITRH